MQIVCKQLVMCFVEAYYLTFKEVAKTTARNHFQILSLFMKLNFIISLYFLQENDTGNTCKLKKHAGKSLKLFWSSVEINHLVVFSLVFDNYSVDFLKKGECFDFNHSLGSLPYFVHHNQTSRSSLSFQLTDLLSLFIHKVGFMGR